MRAQRLITDTLSLEETRFRRTLARGLTLLDEATSDLKGGATLAGDVAFRLYDTYGFPLDLTQDALKARGIGVDMAGFNRAMEKQREDARANWAGSGNSQTEAVWFRLRDTLGATEFLGYSTEAADGEILALVQKGHGVEQAATGEAVAVVVNQTPFYAESGGQQADMGIIVGDNGGAVINDVQKRADGLIVHYGTVPVGHAQGRRRGAPVDRRHAPRRDPREPFGDAPAARGAAQRARHARRAEGLAGRARPAALRLLASQADCAGRDRGGRGPRQPRGAGGRAGDDAPDGPRDGDEVGRDGAVRREVRRRGARGVDGHDAGRRRGAAVFGRALRRHARQDHRRDRPGHGGRRERGRRRRAAHRGADRHGGAQAPDRPGEAPEGDRDDAPRSSRRRAAPRVAELVEDKKRLERELAEAKKRLAMGGGGNGADIGVRTVGATRFMARTVMGIAPKDLKGLVDEGKKSLGSGIVAIVGVAEDGKAGVVVGVTDDLTQRFSAVDLVKRGAEALGGKGGGGRPDMAQAGGPDGAKAAAALAAIEAVIAGA